MNEPEIKMVLKDLMYEVEIETVKGLTAQFIKDLDEYHTRNGKLTERQELSIRRIHREVIG